MISLTVKISVLRSHCQKSAPNKNVAHVPTRSDECGLNMNQLDLAAVQDLSTFDINQAQAAVQQAYHPHELHAFSTCRDSASMIRTVNFGQISVGLVRWASDISIECSYHQAYQINVVLSGELVWERNGTRWTAKPGEAAVFPPNETSPITLWEAGSTVLGIRISEELMNEYLSPRWGTRQYAAPAKLDLRSETGVSWTNYVRSSGQQVIDAPQITEFLGFRSAFASAVVVPLVNFLDANAARTPAPYMITRVRAAVEKDLGRKWRLSDLAAVAGVGPRRLQQAFKENVGLSPTVWLLSVRLERARVLLTDTDLYRTLSVSDVAFACGFNHLGRFSQEFQKYFGLLPSQMREKAEFH